MKMHVAALAALMIAVAHMTGRTSAPPPQESGPSSAFNVTSSSVDDNGFPLNPRWTWQLNGGQPPDVYETCQRPYDDTGAAIDTPFREPQCTTQNPRFDLPRGIRAVVCAFGPNTPGNYLAVPGHVNWQPATFVTPISQTGYNGGDHDMNVFIVPPNGEAVFPGPPNRGFETEFNRDEVVDQFRNGWWDTFRANAHLDARNLHFDGKRTAVVTGLLGLDCDHDCGTELHPVYAMALDTGSLANQQWSVFARNWGNEGFCSSHDEQLTSDSNQLRVTIPWNGTATGAVVTRSAFYAAGSTLASASVNVWVGHGIVVTFTLPPPSAHGLIYGDLDVSWAGATSTTTAVAPTRSGPLPPAQADARPSVDERIERVLRGRPALKRRFDAVRLPALAANTVLQTPVAVSITTEPPQPIRTPSLRSVTNTSIADALDASFAAFCSITAYSPPDAVLKAGCDALRAMPRRQ